MERLTAFVSEHLNDDTTRLVMNRAKWPKIDMDLAVNCIESRRKLKGKVQEWYDEPGLVFPRKLSAEQCSSSATGIYKADLAARICGVTNDAIKDTTVEMFKYSDKGASEVAFKLADLTGGLGVDSWFFSQKAEQVLYCEMLPELCMAAQHNYKTLKAENILVRNAAVISETQIAQQELSEMQIAQQVSSEDKGQNAESVSVFQTPTQILADYQPDIVYMDPARRGEGGKKVFLIEDCTPDVLTLKDEIFQHTRHILLKLSPMADITMVCERLGKCCREVHVVAAGGECKELLIWMDREWNNDYMIHAVELHKGADAGVFSFTTAQEKNAVKAMVDGNTFLFEPGKSLMKAGAFNLISERFEISKLGNSTHYYTFDNNEKAEVLKQHGKVFRILRMQPLDKRTIKAAGKEFPKAEVTARNIPMDTDTLRKKLGVTSGDDAHIFGLKSDTAGMLLLICSVIR